MSRGQRGMQGCITFRASIMLSAVCQCTQVHVKSC